MGIFVAVLPEIDEEPSDYGSIQSGKHGCMVLIVIKKINGCCTRFYFPTTKSLSGCL